MTLGKRGGLAVAMAVAVAGTVALQPREAEAHGRGGHGRGAVVVRGGGFYNPWVGYGGLYGWGWGGPWGPGYYEPEGGVSMGAAMVAGMGAVELNVKPNRADVWVDGKYVAEARDLDGYPSYLWLPDGEHRVVVQKGGFQLFDEPISVHRGMKTEIKVHLQPGDSAPPGPRPADKASEKSAK